MLSKNFVKKLLSRYNGFDLINLILFVVCCVFSIYDIDSHIVNYHKYRTIVNTKLEFSPKIYLPSVTICLPSVMDYNQFRLTFPEEYAKTNAHRIKLNEELQDYAWRDFLADQLTIGQFKLVQPNFKEIFLSCMFRTKDDKFVDCDRFTPIQSHFSLNQFCYIFFEQEPKEWSNKKDLLNFDEEKEFDYSAINKTDNMPASRLRRNNMATKSQREEYFLYDQTKIKNKDWIQIMINTSSLWNGWIDFGLSSEGRFYEMYHGQPNFMCLSTDVVNKVEFTFSQTKIMRLPPPYDSKCFDYTTIGYLDRSHYVETCYANETIRNFNRWPFFLPTSENKFPEIDSLYFTKNNKEQNNNLYYGCSERQTGANCNYTQIEIKMTQLNFCDQTAKVDESVKDYLLKNLTESKKMAANEKSALLNRIAQDDRKNRILQMRYDKLLESNACSLKRFLIVVQFTDEYVTELIYDELNSIGNLITNIGQSISVYLGLCVYDFHKLFAMFFDWFNMYNGDSDSSKKSAKPRRDLLNTKFGRKFSRQLTARLNARKRYKPNNDDRIVEELNDTNDMSDKIKKFQITRDQFAELNRNHNLQLINNGILANYSKRLNNQLAPLNRRLDSELIKSNLKGNLSQSTNLLFLNNISPLLIDNKLFSSQTNKLVTLTKNDQNKDRPFQLKDRQSLIHVDDYLLKIANIHKKTHQLDSSF